MWVLGKYETLFQCKSLLYELKSYLWGSTLTKKATQYSQATVEPSYRKFWSQTDLVLFLLHKEGMQQGKVVNIAWDAPSETCSTDHCNF